MQATHVRDGAVSHVGSDQGQSQTEVRSTPKADVAVSGSSTVPVNPPGAAPGIGSKAIVFDWRPKNRRSTTDVFRQPCPRNGCGPSKRPLIRFHTIACKFGSRARELSSSLSTATLSTATLPAAPEFPRPLLRFLVPRPVLQLALSLFALTLPSAPSARLVTVWSHQPFDSVNA
jgi:hypothetical protein